MIQKFIIHFSVLLWFLRARWSTRQPPSPPTRQKYIGASITIDLQYIRDHNPPKSEDLKRQW